MKGQMNLLDYLSFRLDIIIRIVALVVLCVVFFRLVRRGKWIRWSHPICSACGHNLTGLPETSTNCPECGGELKRVRKTEIWKRRWFGLGVAGIFFLICLVIVAAIAWVHIDKAPGFVLMWMRQNPRVYGMLYTRWKDGELSVAQEAILADEVVGRRGMWDIQSLREQGRVPDSSWRKYALKLLGWPLQARTTIGRGDPLAFKLFVWGGYNGIIRTEARLHVNIDGIEIRSDQGWQRWVNRGVIPAAPSVEIPADVQSQLLDGTHQLNVAVEGQAIDKNGGIIARNTSRFTFALTILPRGKSAITLVKPTITPGFFRSSKDQEICIYLDGRSYPDFLDYDCFPEDRVGGKGYSYRLFARQDGHEYYFGTLIHSRTETYWEPAIPVPPLHWPMCDVIFKVDPEAAKKTIGMYTIVDQGFEVDNVVVRKKPLRER